MIFLSLNLIKTLNFISRPIKDYTDTFLIFFFRSYFDGAVLEIYYG